MNEFISALANKLNGEIFLALVEKYSHSGSQSQSQSHAKLETRIWERYCNLTPQTIGQLMGQAEMGEKIFDFMKKVPNLNLTTDVKPLTEDILEVELHIAADFEWDHKLHGKEEVFSVVVKDSTGNYILLRQYFQLKAQHIDEPHTINFSLQITKPLPPLHIVLLTSEKWLGSMIALPILFDHHSLVLPYEQLLPPTNLLAINTPVADLIKPDYQVPYDFRLFNAVQTEVFQTLYNTDDNVLLAAPNGSGKGVCAEFAIFRSYEKASVMRVVYIGPCKSLVKKRYRDWETKFARGLGLQVVELQGKLETDLKLVKESQIIISTPENWDALSLYWQSKHYILKVSLFIIDDLQLVGSPRGSVLEVIVSRMRYISRVARETKIRIVALATCLTNAVDLCQWIGVSPHGLFNFPPGVRPVPLELNIQGADVDLYDFDDALHAMTELTFAAICPHAKNEIPAIVYVPTHTHALLTAIDLVRFADALHGEKSMLLLDSLELQTCATRIKDSTLKSTLSCGVGFLHEGLSSSDQYFVSCLFNAGNIKVCVVTSSMCWEVPLSAHLVIVMGTRYFDAREKTHIDYLVTDILQMIGQAGRFIVDKSGMCVVLSEAPRKQYYKKFLNEALPVESSLLNFGLVDILNAEVAARNVRTIEGAEKYLSWTYFFERLIANPRYYSNDPSIFHRAKFISEIVKSTLAHLEDKSFLIIGSEDRSLSPLNYGIIAATNYVSCSTVELFVNSLKSATSLMNLFKTLTEASEFSSLPVRFGEKFLLRNLNIDERFCNKNVDFTNPHVKVYVLLKAHLSRLEVDGILLHDLNEVLITATRLLNSMIDVISSNGWLQTALLAMELSQMVTQGLWERDSILLQLPHFTTALAKRCLENPGKSIETVYDLLEMEDDDRVQLLHMSESQLSDVARFCNHFPDIDITYEVINPDSIRCGEYIKLAITLERYITDDLEVGMVYVPKYPAKKQEEWWLVVGDTENDQLLAIDKITLQLKLKTELTFVAPTEVGKKTYTLSLNSDSYMGCDQEYTFTVIVRMGLT